MIVSMKKQKKCFENYKTTNQSSQPPVIVTRFVYSKQYLSIVHASLKFIVNCYAVVSVQRAATFTVVNVQMFSGQRALFTFYHVLFYYIRSFVSFFHSK